MIIEGENKALTMYEGDTGTISIKICGDCTNTDKYVFTIRQDVRSKVVFSQTFYSADFTIDINENITKLLVAGDYCWGLKVIRQGDSGTETHTIVGNALFRVRQGV